MSVGHRADSVDRFTQHWAVHGGHRTSVLGRSHGIRELIGERVLPVEVGTIQRQRSLGFRNGAGRTQELGPNRGFVGPRPEGGPLDARVKPGAAHHRKLAVDAVVLFPPLGEFPVPLVPPLL